MSNSTAEQAFAPSEEQLDRAIEELRGVLKDEEGRSGAGGRGMPENANASVIMDIPVDVQIVLGSAVMPV